MSGAADDPGWAPAIRAIPLLVIPHLAFVKMRKAPSTLAGLRLLWVSFVASASLVAIAALVLAITDSLSPAVDATPVAAGVAGAGVFLQLVARRFAPQLDGDDPAALRATFTRRFFVRAGFAEAAVLVAFAAFIVTAQVFVYMAGFAVMLAAMIDASPSAGRIVAAQAEIEARGSQLDVLDVLLSG